MDGPNGPPYIYPDPISRTRMRLCGSAHALVQKGLGTRLVASSPEEDGHDFYARSMR